MPPPDTEFEISAKASASVRQQFQSGQVVQLPSFLCEQSAQEMQTLLKSHAQWGLATVSANRKPEATLQTHEFEHSREAAYDRAAQCSFSYAYKAFPLMARFWANTLDADLQRVARFFASTSFTSLVADVASIVPTGDTDGHLAWYDPGDFLSEHTDETSPTDSRRRSIAFVLSLTEGWCKDWGGLTHFWGKNGEAHETIVPAFNSLLLFKVPRPHSVSVVAPFATVPRLSIGGWLHE